MDKYSDSYFNEFKRISEYAHDPLEGMGLPSRDAIEFALEQLS